MGRICALDYGSSRVGWALTDPSHVLVTQMGYIRRTTDNQLISEVKDMILEKNIARVIIGVPLNMSGKRSKQTDETLRFVKQFESSVGIPIETIDERLTSVQATRNLHTLDIKTGHNKGRVDAMAAFIMLETWLARESLRKNREK